MKCSLAARVFGRQLGQRYLEFLECALFGRSGAIYVTMSGVALNAINGSCSSGKSLCVFTTGMSEKRSTTTRAVTITPTSGLVNQTQYGTAHIKPVMIDGNIILVQRNLKSLRDFQFDYTVNQFNSLGISALAPNLIYNVNDIAVWNGSGGRRSTCYSCVTA